MMRRSPLFEGMEIPVVPPIVDDVFFGTTNHTNLHERGKHFLTTIERQGGREKVQPKVGPKGEGVGTTESNDADGHGWDKRGVAPGEPGLALSSQNLFTSELADSPVSESLIRSADNPASLPATRHVPRAISYSLPVTAPQALWAGGKRFVVGLSARSLTDGGKGINSFFERLPLDKAFLRDTTFLLIGEGRIPVPAGIDCHFVGHISSQERLAEIYRMLDLFVSASAMETFGMAILEAQACGTPVVAFETGGTPEAVCPVGSRLVRKEP